MIEKTKSFVDNGYWGYFYKEENIPLVVVFSFRDMQKGKFPHFNFFKKTSYNVVFLNCKDNSWYQNGIEGLGDSHDETISNLKMVLHDFKPSYITFYGFSMGGYGALLYSYFLHPDKVVSVSPELELKLDFSRSLENIGDNKTLDIDLMQLLSENTTSDIEILCGDMEPIELYFISKHKLSSNLKSRFIFGCPHYVTTFFNHHNILNQFFDSLSEKNHFEIPEKFQVKTDTNFKFEDSERFFKAFNLHKAKSFKDALNIFTEIEETFKNWAPYWWHKSRTYIRTKEYDKAKSSILKAMKINSDNFYYLFDYANIFRLQHEKEKAYKVFKYLVSKPFVGHRAQKMIEKYELKEDKK